MKDKNDLISIIVPIFNVDKYIEKTIKSLINQTYLNIEIFKYIIKIIISKYYKIKKTKIKAGQRPAGVISESDSRYQQ